MSALAPATPATPASTTNATRRLARLSALAGLLGVVMLGVSYAINSATPPDHATPAQLMAFADAHHTQIVTGAWLQAVGTVLVIAFSLAVVHLAGAAARLAGWLTFYGGLVLVTTGLIETTFYLVGANATQVTTELVSPDLIHASQHLYFMVAAPAVFLPLGTVILASRPLPRVFGYLAYLLGAVFALVGIVGLYAPLQSVGDTLGTVQALWWLLAALTLLVRPGAPSVLAVTAQPQRRTA